MRTTALCTPGDITRIGKRVTIGHGAVIHNATIHDYALVGMGSVVSDWSVVGEWAVVGEGAVVKQHQEIPASHIAVGMPTKVVGQVKPEYKEQRTNFKSVYPDLAKRYPRGLKGIGHWKGQSETYRPIVRSFLARKAKLR